MLSVLETEIGSKGSVLGSLNLSTAKPEDNSRIGIRDQSFIFV
jgi:hypothetical protein